MKELLAADHDERAGRVVVGGCRERHKALCQGLTAVRAMPPSGPHPNSRLRRGADARAT